MAAPRTRGGNPTVEDFYASKKHCSLHTRG